MTKTFYFYSKPEKRKSRLSIAGVYDPDTKLMKIGVAQCDKKDLFIKKFGRSIAEARAIKHPYIDFYVVNGVPGIEFVDSAKQIVKSLIHTK